ncbi:mannose-specific lectin-like [Zingiber officinale]|uniref:Bulb-type lectin domain-containing protein n=1 Tax=Zingiber officinale TaxID=94328 RepID=A0A8J5KDL8_ZINOF|nr:mannose-specific lectin-like [Zingiber officinale]KAG6476883.1 hypothetical protein ZIOFF_066131 [Zingiber officinale]
MASLVMLSVALLLGLFLPSSMANNVLFGGDRLNTGESLRERNFKFTMMSDDCTLVLNDNDQTVWSSPTNGLGNNCFAHLQTNGNLVIRNDNDQVVWSSNTAGEEGNYILVLQNDGSVVIFGRSIWSIPPGSNTATSKGAVIVKRGRSDESTNILYGGHKLRTDESLKQGDYTFVMQSDCNLVLYANNNNQVMWSSQTNNLGTRCFARMQTDGNLVIFEGINFNKIWDSNTRGPEGKYILVLQRDGHVVIYGSPIFTIPNDEPTNRKIAMVTKK